MRIIKEGIWPNNTPINVICKRCYTEFEFEKTEGEKISNIEMSRFALYEINCPLCNKQILVEVNQID